MTFLAGLSNALDLRQNMGLIGIMSHILSVTNQTFKQFVILKLTDTARQNALPPHPLPTSEAHRPFIDRSVTLWVSPANN